MSMDPYPLWTKYRQFKYGDLVQIEYGNRPLGIIVGPPARKYGENPTRTRYVYPKDGDLNAVVPIEEEWLIPKTVNYLQYPVLIHDLNETGANEKWYWPGGLLEMDRDYYEETKQVRMIQKKDIDISIAYIHPAYLTFLTES